MHIVLFVVAGALGLIGLIELIPGILQFIAYIVLNAFMLLGGKSKPLSEFPLNDSVGIGIFYHYHGLASVQAAPLFLGLAALAAYFAKSARDIQKQKLQDALSAAKQAQDAKQLAVQNQQKAEKDRAAMLSTINLLTQEIKELSSAIPGAIREVSHELDLAEAEFGEGVLDPFWDAVERATRNLALIESARKQILSNLHEVRRLNQLHANSSRTVPTQASNLVIDVGDTAIAYSRLQKIIRSAQKRSDFSTIFHLRRQNSILVSGFSTFGQALADLGDRLTTSMDAVTQAVHDNGARLEASFDGLSERTESLSGAQSQILRSLDSSMQEGNRLSRGEIERQRKADRIAIDFLDNIQRGRRPYGMDWKPGTTAR
jgi:hypothetical protein